MTFDYNLLSYILYLLTWCVLDPVLASTTQKKFNSFENEPETRVSYGNRISGIKPNTATDSHLGGQVKGKI